MTEAERIEKDAESIATKLGWDEESTTERNDIIKAYIAGATAENQRLQQLIKEKAEEITKLNKTIRQFRRDDDKYPGINSSHGDRHSGWSV